MNGEVDDRVPVLPPFQSFFANRIAGINTQDARKCPGKVARAQIDIAYRCDFDGIDMGVDGLAPIEACGSRVSFPEFGLPYTTEPAISTLNELDELLIPDPDEDHRFQASLLAAEKIVEEIGNEYFTQASLCGPITFMGELRGLDTFISDLDVHPDLAEDMIEYSTAVFNRYIEEYFRLDVDALVISEPTCAGDYLSAGQFRRFALPAIDRCITLCKRSKKKVILHLCGSSKDILKYISDTDIDAVCLDADIADIPENMKRKTIIGNISGSQFSSGDHHDVLKASIKCIDSMLGERFILGSGCIIPLTSRISNLRMLKYASEYHMLNQR